MMFTLLNVEICDHRFSELKWKIQKFLLGLD